MISERKTLFLLAGFMFLSTGALLFADHFFATRITPGQFSLQFTDSMSNSLESKIINDSPATHFTWTLLGNKMEYAKGSINIPTHETETILSGEVLAGKKVKGKITVRVTDDQGNTRELFRVFR